MPSISRVQLGRRCYVEEEVAQRSLQSIEGEVKQVEGDDCNANSSPVDLFSIEYGNVEMVRKDIPGYSCVRPSFRLPRRTSRQRMRQSSRNKRA